MKVELSASRIRSHLVDVVSLSHASATVSAFISAHDLTAGCGFSGNVFTGGRIWDEGEVIATVSYNGRVWDLDNKEIKL